MQTHSLPKRGICCPLLNPRSNRALILSLFAAALLFWFAAQEYWGPFLSRGRAWEPWHEYFPPATCAAWPRESTDPSAQGGERYIHCLPKLHIVGVPNTGSTSLYWASILSHPQLVRSRTKEPRVWSMYRDSYDLTAVGTAMGPIASVNDTFTLPLYQIDASVGYSLCPRVAANMRTHVPDARIVLIVRNPLHRFISHYNAERSYGSSTEPRTIDEAAEAHFRAWKHCDAMLSPTRKDDLRSCRFDESSVCYRNRGITNTAYFSAGRYDLILQNWYRYFPPSQILVVTTDHIAYHPSIVLHEVWRFWGLDAEESERALSVGTRLMKPEERPDYARGIGTREREQQKPSRQNLDRMQAFFEGPMKSFEKMTSVRVDAKL